MANAVWIDPDGLAGLVGVGDAIDALERLFAGTLPDAPHRTQVPAPPGTLLLMPASADLGTGVKVVTVNPSNPERGLPSVHGFYALFDADTLAPEALIDGGALTVLRTPAVSGLATRHLAREQARRLVIFGAGAQATGHLDAMLAVRPIDRVVIVSRSPAAAHRLASVARDRGVEATVGDPEAVRDADIVCTCTTSREPLFDGSLLRPGTHVNAIGAFQPDMRELDDAAVLGGTVVVETVAAALEEAGEVAIPVREGRLAGDDLVELGDVVGPGGESLPADPDGFTVFKSVGLAVEDLTIARLAVDRLRARGGG